MGCHERGCNLDFLEKLVFGSSSEILRNPVQKTGSQKTQNSRVMPLFSGSEIIFVVGAPFSTMYMPTELYRKGSETPHIIIGIHTRRKIIYANEPKTYQLGDRAHVVEIHLSLHAACKLDHTMSCHKCTACHIHT